MPLVGLLGALTAVTIAALWVVLKLVMYSLKSESQVPLRYVRTVGLLYGAFLSVILWDGVASWASAAWSFIV
jgi:hypothetical protein